jgi:nicotinamidase/pyrazinamidase
MKVLLVIDSQNDFMPLGNLPVQKGDEIIPIINKLLPKFKTIVFTQDWHPSDHKSFASQHENKNVFEKIDLNSLEQVLWPDHCIQGTKGAEIVDTIKLENIKGDFYFFRKGMDPEVDSYSAFYDNGRKNSTELTEFLESKEIDEVFILGLAGDFCCLHTAIDSALEGFKTTFIIDGTRFISEDKTSTLQQLKEAGVNIIESWELDLYNLTN